jgi:hypothetical protein
MATHKYRVREGFTYGAFSQHKAGTILKLDDSTAALNMDKLELAEILPTPVSPTSEESITDKTGIEQPVLPATPKRSLRKSQADN